MSFRNFIASLNQQIGISPPSDWNTGAAYLSRENAKLHI
jgi:hypothetical protein